MGAENIKHHILATRQLVTEASSQLENTNCQPPPAKKHPSIKTSTKQHGNLFKQLFKNNPEKINQMGKSWWVGWVGGLSTYTYNIHTYVCIYYIYSLPLLSAYFMSSFKIRVNFSHLQTDNKIRQSTGRKPGKKKNNLNKLPQIQRQLKKSGLCSFYCGQMIIHQLQQNPYGWRRSAGVELEVSRQVVKSDEHTHTKQARTHAHAPLTHGWLQSLLWVLK